MRIKKKKKTMAITLPADGAIFAIFGALSSFIDHFLDAAYIHVCSGGSMLRLQPLVEAKSSADCG